MSPHRRRKKMFRRFRSSLVWILIISVVVILVAAVLGLGGGLINFLEKHANILDKQHVPMDVDRSAIKELLEQNPMNDRKTIDQMKRKGDKPKP